MGTNTTNYNLYKPTPKTEAGWGEEINTNFDTIDTNLKSVSDTAAAGGAHATADGSSHADVATNTLKVTNATHTGDVTGATELTIAANAVDDTHIDWGVGANQVSAVDVPIADAGSIITGEEVETALQENRTAINLNTSKVTNATHTGDVTGATELTIAAKAVDVAMIADGTDGELITWSAAGVADTVAVGTATHVLTSNGVGVAPTFQAAGGGGSYYSKYLTSGAIVTGGTAGNTSITGVGFQPTLVMFDCWGATGQVRESNGGTDGTVEDCHYVNGSGAWATYPSCWYSVSGSQWTRGFFVSFDADGFTMNITINEGGLAWGGVFIHCFG